MSNTNTQTDYETYMDSTKSMDMYELWEQRDELSVSQLEKLAEMMLTPKMENKLQKLLSLKDTVTEAMSGTCTWWALPEWAKDALKPLTLTKKEWGMPVYKLEGDNNWYMDVPMLLTWKEALCMGTERCLDEWYEKLSSEKPTKASKMYLTLSKYPMKDATTTLEYQGDDASWPEASYYLDTGTNMLAWLCPYLPWLMNGKPEKMWLTLKVTK